MAPVEPRPLRHKLEAFHGHADPKAVETAWPYLGDPDRFIRWAARVAIEFQDPATWRDRGARRIVEARGVARGSLGPDASFGS